MSGVEENHYLSKVIHLRANNAVRKLCIKHDWEWKKAEEVSLLPGGLQEQVFDSLLEFNKKICNILHWTNEFQWEIWAKRTRIMEYYNHTLPRVHNRWMRSFFIAVRPLGLLLFLRAWRLETVKGKRKGIVRDVTGIMVGFCMSSLGTNYIQHLEVARRKELRRNCVPLALALYRWYALGKRKSEEEEKEKLSVSPAGFQLVMKQNIRQNKLKFRLQLNIMLTCAADLLLVSWRAVARRMALALRKAERRLSLGHIRK